MKDPHKKDNLTDLVDILASSEVDANAPSTGQVVTSEGETVTLSAEDDDKLTILAKKLVAAFKQKKRNEAIVRASKKKKQ